MSSTTKIYLVNRYVDPIHLQRSMRYYPETSNIHTRRLSIKIPTACRYITRVTATVTLSLTALAV